jgi:hypothetical protein
MLVGYLETPISNRISYGILPLSPFADSWAPPIIPYLSHTAQFQPPCSPRLCRMLPPLHVALLAYAEGRRHHLWSPSLEWAALELAALRGGLALGDNDGCVGCGHTCYTALLTPACVASCTTVVG